MASRTRTSPPITIPRRRALGLALGSLGAGLWPFATEAAQAVLAPYTLRHRLLHSFGDPAITRAPAEPRAALIEGSDGNLYGTTITGGIRGQGTVFIAERRLNGVLRLRAVHYFDGIEGLAPWAPLLEASDGNLYGTTYDSDQPQSPRGTIFRIAPDGTFTSVFAFGGERGQNPRAGLVEAGDGRLYGTTSRGGTVNGGTAFALTLAGDITKLHDFDGFATGGAPHSEMLVSSDGLLYGCATFGGPPDGRGVVYRLSPEGEYGVVHAFRIGEGDSPTALIEADDGSKYGLTEAGGHLHGIAGVGTSFHIGTDDSFTRAYQFRPQSPIGYHPCNGLLALAEGGMVGTTEVGGALGGGTVFRLLGRRAQALHSFDASYTGAKSGLLRGSDGRLYGTTSTGGAFGRGTIYSLELRRSA